MKRVLFISVISLVFLFGCEREGPVISDTSFFIHLVDKEGNDLLNPDSKHAQAVVADRIQVYHIKNGVKVRDMSEMMKYPYSFIDSAIVPSNGLYEMMLFLNNLKTEKLGLTIIDWGNGRHDTLKTEFSKPTRTAFIKNRVWLNDSLVWEMQAGRPEIVRIVW